MGRNHTDEIKVFYGDVAHRNTIEKALTNTKQLLYLKHNYVWIFCE